jgi:glycosyltransferase involved in cell wall biosynthesis/peptidoglycan/xylan/chitin deacetylase (PgdA/CDA1 family)
MANEVGLQVIDVTASAFAYARQLRELLEAAPPQIVHMHSVFIPQQAVLAKQLRKRGIPYLITPHAGLAPQVLARGRLKKSIYSHLRERPRFMAAAAVALVTPAEEKAVRAYMPKYRGIVRWMPNPVEVEMLDPHRWHGVTEQKRLVFLGRFDVLVKGIDILIEIARLLPDVQVELYGTEDPKTRDWLLKIKENLPDNVSFHDPIFGPEKAEVLSKASIYIQPSRWEGFPVSVAECQYLGVPSSISNALDLAELFTERDLGLVLSLEPAIAAAQIRQTLADRAQLENWSRRGRQFALEHFVPAASAQNYMDLYEQIVGSARSADAVTADAEVPAGSNGHARAAMPDASSSRSRGRRLLPPNVRTVVKEGVSQIVEQSNELLGYRKGPRSIVLCYHSINPQPHGLAVEPRVFRQQLATLKEMGFEFQTFGDYIDRLMRLGMPTRNVAVITFDDGYEDNFTQAAPILTDMNVPATFFVTSGLLTQEPAVVERFKELVKFDTTFMSPEQLQQMHEAGLEIGAHTHTHPNLARLPAIRARWEITHSKQLIEESLGARVRSFAYPFGKRHIHYTHRTVDIVRESGFSGAGSVAFRAVSARRSVRIFEIPRFFVTCGDTPTQFRQKVSGHFDWLGLVQEMSPRWLKATVSPEDQY